MNKEDIEKILNNTNLDISKMTKTAYNQMIRMILEKGISPQEAQKQIKKALASVNENAAGIIAASLSTALGKRFSTSYVKNFEVDGVKLSQRLYNNSKDVAGATQKVINQAIKENKSIANVSKLLYEGYDFKLDPLNVKKNKTIPKWLKKELNKEPSQRSFKQVSDIRTPALRTAFTDALKTKTFQEQEKALKRAFYEKSRYYADRIAQNEIMKAYSVGRAEMIKEDDEIEVVRVALSRSHPRKDICDYHTSVNKYGLGKGVYPKDNAPVPPFHPFCRCDLIEKITLNAKDAKFNPKADKDFMDTLGNYERSLIVGSNRRLDMFYKSGDVIKSAYLGNPIHIKDIGQVKALGVESIKGTNSISFGYGGKFDGFAENIREEAKAVINKIPKPKNIILGNSKAGLFSERRDTIETSSNSMVFIHEYGHSIDHKLSFGVNGKFSKRLFNASVKDADVLKVKIEKDVLQSFKNKWYQEETLYYKRGKNKGKIKGTRNNPIEEKFGWFSDIIDSMTGGIFQDEYYVFGHGRRYYSKTHSRQNENFANMFLFYSDEDMWNDAKKLFPNLAKEFESIMKEIQNGDYDTLLKGINNGTFN